MWADRASLFYICFIMFYLCLKASFWIMEDIQSQFRLGGWYISMSHLHIQYLNLDANVLNQDFGEPSSHWRKHMPCHGSMWKETVPSAISLGVQQLSDPWDRYDRSVNAPGYMCQGIQWGKEVKISLTWISLSGMQTVMLGLHGVFHLRFRCNQNQSWDTVHLFHRCWKELFQVTCGDCLKNTDIIWRGHHP